YTYFELEPAPMTHRRYEVHLAKEQPTEAAIITMTAHGDGAGLLVSLANGTVALYNFRDRLQLTRQSWIKTEPPIWLHCEHDEKCPDRVYSAARSRGGLQLHGIRKRDWSIQPLCREFGGQLGAQFASACVFDRDTVIVGDKRGGLTTMR
ncbi:ubiquitin-specific protease ubp15, partial [Perkinsus olseni]